MASVKVKDKDGFLICVPLELKHPESVLSSLTAVFPPLRLQHPFQAAGATGKAGVPHGSYHDGLSQTLSSACSKGCPYFRQGGHASRQADKQVPILDARLGVISLPTPIFLRIFLYRNTLVRFKVIPCGAVTCLWMYDSWPVSYLYDLWRMNASEGTS